MIKICVKSGRFSKIRAVALVLSGLPHHGWKRFTHSVFAPAVVTVVGVLLYKVGKA